MARRFLPECTFSEHQLADPPSHVPTSCWRGRQGSIRGRVARNCQPAYRHGDGTPTYLHQPGILSRPRLTPPIGARPSDVPQRPRRDARMQECYNYPAQSVRRQMQGHGLGQACVGGDDDALPLGRLLPLDDVSPGLANVRAIATQGVLPALEYCDCPGGQCPEGKCHPGGKCPGCKCPFTPKTRPSGSTNLSGRLLLWEFSGLPGRRRLGGTSWNGRVALRGSSIFQ